MDVKRLLLILGDANRDGKVDLADLPGVVARAVAAKSEVDELLETLREFSAARKLTSNGQHVTPDQLSALIAEGVADLKTLGDKTAASSAAIAAGGTDN